MNDWRKPNVWFWHLNWRYHVFKAEQELCSLWLRSMSRSVFQSFNWRSDADETLDRNMLKLLVDTSDPRILRFHSCFTDTFSFLYDEDDEVWGRRGLRTCEVPCFGDPDIKWLKLHPGDYWPLGILEAMLCWCLYVGPQPDQDYQRGLWENVSSSLR